MSLTPQADARAAELGTAAGELRLAGQPWEPPGWRTGDELPAARWAALWWRAFVAAAGDTLPHP
ncbi:hypothetical protein SAMN04515671_2925 [Nakamurella panacisegetis]|uniref:Uncharacterized protein n=1 Tax=Nakamurella panacisegetis TaxID=1090615 RepID=A0A1H0PYG3_9ACTN|nr:hypothetical protein [Nakamurella panacisegetis]SDP09546.1 hypothetical protein SAMN04515671_2925 [Nakamurella panacisegetis]